MKTKRPIQLLLSGFTMALLTVVCSSGYITPDSLTATANAPTQTALPTAFLVLPTNTASPAPTETETPDPLLASLTPIEDTIPAVASSATSQPLDASAPPIPYSAQSGDTLASVAARFGVNPFEIVSIRDLPEIGLISAEQLLMIPQRLTGTTPAQPILPDSEMVYSPSAIDFDVKTYVNTIGGYLSSYTEFLGSRGVISGAEIIEKAAIDNSINPRVLLSLLEYQSHWVLGQPTSLAETDYPMGHVDLEQKGLQKQLTWAVNQLSSGYYKWRAGAMVEIEFRDGTTTRIAPSLNAGSAAIQYYFSKVYSGDAWQQAVNPESGLTSLHTTMFSDPWLRAAQFEPLFPPELEQPQLILPFLIGQRWSYTGGPHGAWEGEGSQAALDFAPGSVEHGCVDSDNWVVASASGRITRSAGGVVVLDLDGDGNEQTGWTILYLHLTRIRVQEGDFVEKSTLLGHPSCEGGIATGTHLHMARKFNGEWIAADGPIPFVLSGWQASAGALPYQGTLIRGEDVIRACTCGSFETNIRRTVDDPY